ncbi:helix-turn-helix transcriptional regulator [Pseudomonas luteola]|uniref:helix-turn-helix domain-containing protein n=1 Tax=Pseudomonas luteola TaxID=47886 RepID=UPI003A853787
MADQFHHRLRKERERLGYTQADLSRYGEITQMQQESLERGEQSPSLAYLRNVCRAGVDMTYITRGRRRHQVEASHDFVNAEAEALFRTFCHVDKTAIRRWAYAPAKS